MAVVFEELWPGANGTAWDSGRWPSTAAGSGSTIDIQSARGRMLCEQPPERPLVWALADHDAVTDFDLLLDWTPANTDDFRLGIIFGCTSTTAGNMLYIRPFSGTNGQIRLYNGVDLTVNINGNASVLEISDGTELVNQAVTFSSPASTRYACRVQREGTALRCRVWPFASAEPGTWHIDTTLTANPSGTIGLMAMSHSIGQEPDIRWGPITLDDGEEAVTAELAGVLPALEGSFTASVVLDPTIPATVPGTDTGDLTSPTTRAGKDQRWAWWTGTRWDGVLPTSSGWRLYTDLTGTMDQGAVVDSRQAARVDTVWHDGTLWVARGHTSAPRISRYLLDGGSYTADETDVALPAGLAAANGDASPLVLFRSTNGRLWVACNNGANVVVAVSDDDGDTWDDETVLSVSETGVAMLAQTGDTIVLLSTLNDGGGRAVRTIDQDAADISSGEWATEALPSLPGGISSDDHGMAVSVGGHIYATSKTQGSESSGTPLLYLLDRTPAGSWSATTLRPGPDDGETRPHLVATATTLYVAFGSFTAPTNAWTLTIPRDTLNVPSPEVLLDGGDYGDSAVPPRDVSGESGLLWLAHDRSDESITRVWAALPTEAILDGQLPALTGEFTTAAEVTAELQGQLPPLQGSFEVEATVTTELAGTLPALTGSFTADVTVTADLAGQLPPLAGSFDVEATVTAELDGHLPALEGSFTAQVGNEVTVELTGILPALQGSFDVEATVTAELAGQLPPLEGSFSAQVGDVVSVDLTGLLPALEGEFTVAATVIADLAGQLPPLVGAFTVEVTEAVDVTLVGVLPALNGQFSVFSGGILPGPPIGPRTLVAVESGRTLVAIESGRTLVAIESGRTLVAVE